jgi:alpha-tubulin suppressor-like RCC1 family protein
VWAWGNNAYGITGTGTGVENSETFPKQVPGVANITDIQAGGGFVIALDASKHVWIWGQMSRFDQNFPAAETPRLVTLGDGTPVGDVEQIAASEGAAFARTSTGQLYSWGDNSYYNALGQGGSVSSAVYASLVLGPISGAITDVTDIAAGRNTAYAISGGNLYAWGADNSGALGCSGCSYSGLPVQVSLPAGVSPQKVSSSSNAFFAFAVTSDGLYAWGDNSDSQAWHSRSIHYKPAESNLSDGEC